MSPHGSTRIIAGAAGGLHLRVPPGTGTRPTPDRVREALFSILIEPGDRVLDLFAGTGALGLEALSRGARHVTFVEHDPRVLTILRQNVAHVTRALPADTQILHLAVKKALATLSDATFDLVFVDPPYAAGELIPTLAALCDGHLLAPGARIICEHSSRQPAPAPPPCLQLRQTRSWGEVALTFYAREQP